MGLGQCILPECSMGSELAQITTNKRCTDGLFNGVLTLAPGRLRMLSAIQLQYLLITQIGRSQIARYKHMRYATRLLTNNLLGLANEGSQICPKSYL